MSRRNWGPSAALATLALLALLARPLSAQRPEDRAAVDSAAAARLAWARGIMAIIAVQNGVSPPRIARFGLDRTGEHIIQVSVLDRHLPIADEPTIGTVVGSSFVYVANSQWDKHTEDGRPRSGARLTAPVLLAVPLPR